MASAGNFHDLDELFEQLTQPPVMELGNPLPDRFCRDLPGVPEALFLLGQRGGHVPNLPRAVLTQQHEKRKLLT